MNKTALTKLRVLLAHGSGLLGVEVCVRVCVRVCGACVRACVWKQHHPGRDGFETGDVVADDSLKSVWSKEYIEIALWRA